MENYNPPPLILAFDARGTTSQTINVPMEGTTRSLTIYSYRDTKINGKVTDSDLIDFTTKITSGTNVSDTWIFTKKVVNDALSYELEIEISPNLGGARTGSITLTQESSGKTVTINISQAAGVVIQEYVFTGPTILNLMFLADGGTRTLEVESYALYSDGSKVGLVPYVDSKPTWLDIEISPKNQVIGNTKYSVKVTASINPTSEPRRGYLVLNQGVVEGKELTFNVSQEIHQDVTLTLKFPTIHSNGSGAFFAENESPNNTQSGAYYNFNFVGDTATFTYEPSVGILANLSTPGSTKYVKSGDKVKVYTLESGRWIYLSTFTMTSGSQNVIL